MKEKVKFYGSILILVVFIPYLITVYLNGGFGIFSRLNEDEQLEQQVLSVLAAEMPADYELECLKAQAVIVRTNLCKETAEGWSESQMRDVWGDAYEENRKKLEAAVLKTAGQILTYEGNPIRAAFHRACNGRTREASSVPGQEEYVYLQGVDSKEDILADGFLSIGYMEKTDMAAVLRETFPEEKLDPEKLPDALEIVERDRAGYVTKIQYGATIANGEAVREILGLNSACFYFSELEGKIRIVTKGIGHGLGFSQYGAQQLAKTGWKYKELLQYYYHDVKLEL